MYKSINLKVHPAYLVAVSLSNLRRCPALSVRMLDEDMWQRRVRGEHGKEGLHTGRVGVGMIVKGQGAPHDNKRGRRTIGETHSHLSGGSEMCGVCPVYPFLTHTPSTYLHS